MLGWTFGSGQDNNNQFNKSGSGQDKNKARIKSEIFCLILALLK